MLVQSDCTSDRHSSIGLTVVATVTADGTKLPLYVVFSGATKQPPLSNLAQLQNRVYVSATKSGFVNTEVMLDYVAKVLSKHHGALLTLDMARAHMCAQVRVALKASGIIPYELEPRVHHLIAVCCSSCVPSTCRSCELLTQATDDLVWSKYKRAFEKAILDLPALPSSAPPQEYRER